MKTKRRDAYPHTPTDCGAPGPRYWPYLETQRVPQGVINAPAAGIETTKPRTRLDRHGSFPHF